MQAIQILQPGGPEALTLQDLPTPTPGPGEALIRIEASGVNFIDVYLREGRYPAPLPLYSGPGGRRNHRRARRQHCRQRLQGRRSRGMVHTSRERTRNSQSLRSRVLIRVPDAVTSQQAAAAMLQGMTAHYLAHSTYPIQPGDKVLVHAGAGGVGLLLIQMAKSLGARVFTTVSNEEKADLARNAGADEIISLHPRRLRRAHPSLCPWRPPRRLRLRRQNHLREIPRSPSPARHRVSSLEAPAEQYRPSIPSVSRSLARSTSPVPTLKDYIATREELEFRANDCSQRRRRWHSQAAH